VLPIPVVVPIIVVSVLLELAWSHRHRLGLYTARGSAASIGTEVINQIGSVALLGWKYLALAAAASLVPWSIPLNAGTIVVGLLGIEFFCNWYHRSSHGPRVTMERTASTSTATTATS
jgi:hypothetical protein